jgi:hypothetical protein
MPDQPYPRLARFLVTAAALYAVLTVLLTWPVAARLASHVPFYNDSWIFVWDLYWFRDALLSPALSLYETPLLFHPNGIPLAFHTLTPLNGALALPLVGLLGPLAAHNVLFLASFVLTALAMTLLAFRVTGSRAGALLAGFLFAFSPYRMAHGYHLNLLSLETLPLFALSIVCFLEKPRWRSAVSAAALGAATYYLCLVYGYFAFLLALVLVGHAALTRKGILTRDFFGRGAGLAALALLLVLPGVIPALAESSIEPYYFHPVDVRFSADLFSWLTPSLLHSFAGGYTMKVYQHLPGVLAEWTTYVGFTVLFLVAAAWRSRREEPVGRWLVTALVFAVLAMGPCLQILGRRRFEIAGLAFSVPLPYGLLKSIPVLNSLREPSRFAALVTLATSVLAAFGVKALGSGRLSRRTPRFLRSERRVAAAAFVLALFEFISVPLPTSRVEVPGFLRELAREPGDFAVLHAPGSWAFRENLYYQTVHGKRIFEGYIARIPSSNLLFLSVCPVAQDPALWDFTRRSPGVYARWIKRYDVRYALVYRNLYEKEKKPAFFQKAVDNLLALPGARIVVREENFAAVRLPP